MYWIHLIKRNIVYSNRQYSKQVSNKWKSVVGLEVHAQISSNSKLFSGSSNEFASPVNNNVSLFDCSIPGTLPVLNKKCVEAGIKTAIALNCKVSPVSMFDRKHYFYADIPAGYQITQQRAPLALEGNLEFQVFTPGIHKKPYTVNAKIKQIQLEQDSGKSLHEDDRSLVDLNRAGAPLMELVFDPDLSDGEEAAALIKELVIILQRIGTCSCKMEEGALRVDANISIHKPGEPLGVRTEVKNIGSIRGVAGAIKYEIKRQIKVLESGGRIVNETRAWEATSKTTLPMRDKEQQQDYRYMPEPNLPPLHVAIGPIKNGCVNVDEIEKQIPELPSGTRTRLIDDFGLQLQQSIILVNNPILLNMFEEAVKGSTNYQLLANLLINELLTIVNKNNMDLENILVDGKTFSEIASLINDNQINKNTAKLIINEVITGDLKSPAEIIEKNNWIQISDVAQIEKICTNILNENKDIVEQYKKGKTKVFNSLMGKVANNSKQMINMALVPEIMKKLLSKM
ncbi:PREDICTED: glutamyl-tRNA(Gln) amidotransferase subunit B, mitochondrial [Nicrophorus vespilloides]|uniref:Glutamyl-tRNA(Gln) amidotransferase subunit B, mitochondrial n=1 Tax=Nicrophorus vespilloides TaxID=110193 RepID=A0ABM1MV83_NICVS|nr:PREDICTED: glutamyl-tRNA(Gln) amidotransferase subunit B, mitochondrial [Nicrophorus vespilloides]